MRKYTNKLSHEVNQDGVRSAFEGEGAGGEVEAERSKRQYARVWYTKLVSLYCFQFHRLSLFPQALDGLYPLVNPH